MILQNQEVNKDIIIGIDAGTSLIKAVAFTINGKELGISSIQNEYKISPKGKATQSLELTWKNCCGVIKNLKNQINNLENRVYLISVTGQGDGTWLIDKNGEPVCDAWLWLDSRSSDIAKKLSTLETEEMRFISTGTGMFSGQQSSQLLFMEKYHPEILDKSKTAFHCKDWLYYKLTGIKATDPSESCFTFGNFRTQDYDDNVINSLGLNKRKNLLPQIINGSKTNHSLTSEASRLLGLKSGTPIVLSYIDAVCTFLGSGGYDINKDVGNSSLGTTSGHMKANLISKIKPNTDLKSGYVMLLPIEKTALQFQTNMSGMININWLMSFVNDIFKDFDIEFNNKNFLNKIDSWIKNTEPQKLIYHPYISEAGERGPFINSEAQASLLGLDSNHRFPEILQCFIEGLCFAAKECYLVMGEIPKEIRLAGGGSQSDSIRKIFANILKTNIRTSNRKEAGAAGAAMTGAISLGVYNKWDECFDEWVNPFLGDLEKFDKNYSDRYNKLFETYLDSRSKIMPIWKQLS
ncbi:carbohydrate kinase [Pelagibacterales bacterium SAG-MED31]|nr:carbohydrate kinase [Pelagibacterales bacterium SAG-MED31]